MKTLNLVFAALLISKLLKTEVTDIQFEDGSGKNFNYKTLRNSDWRYINIEAAEKELEKLEKAQEIINKYYDRRQLIFNTLPLRDKRHFRVTEHTL